MADPSGFLKHSRQGPARRPIPLRLRDWNEVYEPFDEQDTRDQAARCMDCGIPFCHQGCPLGNIIPEWNDLVRTGKWEEASDRLHATNNFPEFTGRLCPAPCEAACVLGIGDDPVVDQAGRAGDRRPRDRRRVRADAAAGGAVHRPIGRRHRLRAGRTGRRPAAGQGRSRRHRVRAGRPDRRADAVRHPRVQDGHGTCWTAGWRRWRPRASRSSPTARSASTCRVEQLQHDFDAVVIATGSTVPRELTVDGRHLEGVHLAMAYLIQQNEVLEGTRDAVEISAEGKNVMIIGGGDTGADCYGTALRQNAASVTQLDIHVMPPTTRDLVHAVADIPADAADLGRARGGWRAGLRRQLHLDRGHGRSGRAVCTWSRASGSPAASSRPRAPRRTSTPT